MCIIERGDNNRINSFRSLTFISQKILLTEVMGVSVQRHQIKRFGHLLMSWKKRDKSQQLKTNDDYYYKKIRHEDRDYLAQVLQLIIPKFHPEFLLTLSEFIRFCWKFLSLEFYICCTQTSITAFDNAKEGKVCEELINIWRYFPNEITTSTLLVYIKIF